MKKVYKTLSKQDWQKLVTKWLASNSNQPNFCEQHRVKYTQFAYWRGKLLAEARDKGSSNFAKVVVKSNSNQSTKKFIPPGSASLFQHKEHNSIQIHLPTGARVIVTSQFDSLALKQVLQLLGGIR